MSLSHSKVVVVGEDDASQNIIEKLKPRSLPIELLDARTHLQSADVIVITGKQLNQSLDHQLQFLKNKFDFNLGYEQVECATFHSFSQLLTLLKTGHSSDRLFEQYRVRHIYIQVEQQLTGLIGESETIQQLKRLIQRLAPSRKPILITGPTGSGKELVAQAIHDASQFHRGAIICVNCGAIPENLIESLLFGHEKGSFTGAEKQTEGYLSQAAGGTLFLDELGEMPLLLQAKLLRVLETGRYTRVGGQQELEFKGRILAATHVNLEEAVATKRFREDLYYRLNVLTINVSELNRRKDDIPLLVEHFAQKSEYPKPFTPSAVEYLQRMNWPGNVRELRNAVERLCLLSDADRITPDCIQQILNLQPVDDSTALDELATKILSLDVKDKTSSILNALLLRALRDSNGNKSEAARLLGVHRKVVERRYFSNQTFFDQALEPQLAEHPSPEYAAW